jgi:nucleotidyltransferase/DNA polymerase involved in DNA repair
MERVGGTGCASIATEGCHKYFRVQDICPHSIAGYCRQYCLASPDYLVELEGDRCCRKAQPEFGFHFSESRRLPTATQVARTIREQIRTELQLTASAGVASNKFLAKITSDWKKPNGLFVIQLEEVDAFLLPLPVGRLPGVGKVTEEKLKGLDVHTIADFAAPRLVRPRVPLRTLRSPSLRIGARCRREQSRARSADTIHLSGRYVQRRMPLADTEHMIRRLAELTWAALRDERRIARTVVLKLKTAEFKILTRSHTPLSPPSSCEELTAIALSLRERVALGPQQRFRLVCVGVSNFLDQENISAQPGRCVRLRAQNRCSRGKRASHTAIVCLAGYCAKSFVLLVQNIRASSDRRISSLPCSQNCRAASRASSQTSNVFAVACGSIKWRGGTWPSAVGAYNIET